MAFREEHLKQADRMVRQVNTLLRQAADTFGIESEQYQRRKAAVEAAFGKSQSMDRQGAFYTSSKGSEVMQIRRTRAVLQQASRATQTKLLEGVKSRFASIPEMKKKMLEQYTKRTGIDPSKVDPSIKGRKERAAVRKRQQEKAIKDQADYYTKLNRDIENAIRELYDKESEIGDITEVHMNIGNRMYGTLEEREDLLRELREEIERINRREEHVTTAYESGLGGSILGIGGMSSGQL